MMLFGAKCMSYPLIMFWTHVPESEVDYSFTRYVFDIISHAGMSARFQVNLLERNNNKKLEKIW